MAGMSPDGGIQVNIFGQVYHIKGGEDPEHTRELAVSVDEKMSFIARQVSVPDNFRIAVLTALHLADEYDTLLKEHEELQEKVAAKADRLEALLDGVEQSAGGQTTSVFSAAD